MKIPFFLRREGSDGKNPNPMMNEAGDDPIFNEQFKALRAKFEYRAEMLNCKVVAVTSSITGEGKTVSVANLALNLALAGRKKVLLIDVDLRKSDLAERLGISPLPGLSEYLAGSVALKDILRKTRTPGLYVIPAGTRITASADMVAGEKFRSFIKEIRPQFDMILLDTPPIIPVADTLALRDQVDGFVFIFRTGFTPHNMFRQAVEEIGEKNILGVVLNGVEPQTEKYYHRYYGKYYRHADAQ
ncbi:MAG: CpsD/CapB family tyrosine-protein kinase [Deltaproteobacteria bacterium]